MNCKDIKEKMSDYLLDDNLPQEFEEHLAHCPDCSAEFEQLEHFLQTLKPKVNVRASDNFTNNIIKKMKKEKKKMKKRTSTYLKIAAVILLLTIPASIFVFNKNADSGTSGVYAANRIFTESLITLSKNTSMSMEMKIRTVPGDNFELIGTDYDFVNHRIKVEFSSPKKWMMEKQGRRVLCDGENQYLEIKNHNFILKASKNAGFVSWLSIFLTPDKILETEKNNSEKTGSNYTVKEIDNQLVLTVFESAQGDFTNDYLKNSTVTGSDNKRVFCFDKNTFQLLSFELYIIENGKETLIMKTTEIKYDVVFNPEEFGVKNFGNKEIKIQCRLVKGKKFPNYNKISSLTF